MQGVSSSSRLYNICCFSSQNPAASLSEKSLSFKGGFELCVLPGHVMLARLNDDFPIAECSNILVSVVNSFLVTSRICYLRCKCSSLSIRPVCCADKADAVR